MARNSMCCESSANRPLESLTQSVGVEVLWMVLSHYEVLIRQLVLIIRVAAG